MATVFFSYSHADEALRDRLESHLSLLKREGSIEAWHDRRIVPGDEGDREIDEAIKRADVILLLVSSDFINSNYCYDIELAEAMRRHTTGEARVIPIILRHCDWKSAPFGKLQALPKNAKPIATWNDLDEAFLDVVTGIRSALAKIRPITTSIERSAQTVASAKVSVTSPRSSNLRLRKTFTDADRDSFLHETFDHMMKFFQNSLAELGARNPSIEGRFRQIDANVFTATIYENGKNVARCLVGLNRVMKRSITYSNSDDPSENSYSGWITVEADNQGMYLKNPSFGFGVSTEHEKLTPEGAAEAYWGNLIKNLQ